MFEKINQHIAEAEAATPNGKEELEAYRLQYLGKKGVLTDLFAMMKEVPAEQRKEFGQLVNKLKKAAGMLDDVWSKYVEKQEVDE